MNNPAINPPNIKAYYGLFSKTNILLDNGEIISARPYGSNREAWEGRKGYFNVYFPEDWEWGIIFQAVFDDEE